MTNIDIKRKAEEIFTFIYKEVNPSFRFPQGYGASILDSFADSLLARENGLVSLGLLVDFCIHQAHLWRDVERWRGRFNITWAFGPKAIDRFYSSKTGTRYYQNLWLSEMNKNREDLKVKFIDFKEHPLQKFVYIEAEDGTKARFVGTEAGLVLCMSLTTLYTPHSPICEKCDLQRKCKRALRKRNPELLRIRMIKN